MRGVLHRVRDRLRLFSTGHAQRVWHAVRERLYSKRRVPRAAAHTPVRPRDVLRRDRSGGQAVLHAMAHPLERERSRADLLRESVPAARSGRGVAGGGVHAGGAPRAGDHGGRAGTDRPAGGPLRRPLGAHVRGRGQYAVAQRLRTGGVRAVPAARRNVPRVLPRHRVRAAAHLRVPRRSLGRFPDCERAPPRPLAATCLAACYCMIVTRRPTRLRILLADDHHVVRQALRALLERHGFEIVAEASDGRAAAEMVATLQPDVAVLDVAMPVLGGVDAAAAIARVTPGTRVILLTALSDAQFVAAALQAGVRGFVAKVQDIEELVHAIWEVSGGGLYVSPEASQAVLDAVSASHPAAGRLSERERQGLKLVAEGKSTKQIAQGLEIRVKAAEVYRGRVMEKLNIHGTAGLVRYAIREGLILP